VKIRLAEISGFTVLCGELIHTAITHPQFIQQSTERLGFPDTLDMGHTQIVEHLTTFIDKSSEVGSTRFFARFASLGAIMSKSTNDKNYNINESSISSNEDAL
jgi:hypothetical protein